MDPTEILVLSDDSVSLDNIHDLPEIDFVGVALAVKYPTNRPPSVISICSNISTKYSNEKSPQDIRQNTHNLSDSDEENLPKIYVMKSKEVYRADSRPHCRDTQTNLKRNISPNLRDGRTIAKKKNDDKKDCDLSPGKIHKSEYFKHIKNGEFLKCIKLVIGVKLHEQPWWDDVHGKLRDEGVSLSVDTNTNYPIVHWLRLTLAPQSTFIPTDNYWLVLESKEVAGLIKTKKLIENLRTVIGDLKAKIIENTNIQITLVVYRMKDFLRKAKARKKRTSTSEQNDSSGKYLTENELEMALTGLMLRLQVCAVMVESSQELSQLLGHCNKSVAEEPHKKFKYQYEDEAGVLRGENRTCIKVDALGNGLLRVWQQALSKMSGIGQNMARELSRKYPSPHSLRNASTTEIADFVVNGRRVGVEHARRIRAYLNETDGNFVLI